MTATTASVRVPATTANMGPGFDCLGMALALFNTVTLSYGERQTFVVRGEGSAELPAKGDNLVARTLAAFFRASGHPAVPIEIELDNAIPIARGMGSSAAAIVGTLVAANELFDRPFGPEALLSIATDIEGHPDNVAAALLGGMTVCVRSNNGHGLSYITVPVPEQLRAVVFIPHFRLATAHSRQVLPERVTRADAVYNIGRTSLLVAAFATGRLDALRIATQDRLHQPYREQLFPAAKGLLAAAIEAGGLGAFLSGSGPTILALTSGREDQVAAAFETAARALGTAGKAVVLDISPRGATVI